MTRIMRIQYFIINLAALTIFIVDRAFKYYFLKNPAEIFGGDFFNLVSLRFAKNFGVAFGIMFNQKFLLVLVVILIFILFWFLIKSYRQRNIWEIFGLTLVVAGAVSNFIDRLRFGFVIDYIDVPFFTVLNLADCMITVGVGILLLSFWLQSKADKIKSR